MSKQPAHTPNRAALDTKERLQCWLPPALIREVDDAARRAGVNRSQWIARALRAAVESPPSSLDELAAELNASGIPCKVLR